MNKFSNAAFALFACKAIEVYGFKIIIDDLRETHLLKKEFDALSDDYILMGIAFDKKTGEVKVNTPPTVIYEDEEYSDKIGNGSHVTCEFSVYDWESFGKKGVGVWLNKVTINKLVEYGHKTDLDFDDEVASDVPF